MKSFVVEDYKKAQKMAFKEKNRAMMKKESPYPIALDDILADKKTAGQEDLGILSIPLTQIKGTKTAGRQNAFTCNFLPLFDEDTEFAMKWMNLMESQMEEGIREPIIVYEYLNNYYVQEGNKRVSVLKFLNSVMIEAKVTRILPEKSKDKEIVLYYEFLDFSHQTGIHSLVLSKSGGYDQLLKLIGKEKNDVWTKEEREDFEQLWSRFSYQYEKMDLKNQSKSAADAFLSYLKIHSFETFKNQDTLELSREIQKMKKEFLNAQEGAVETLMNPEEKKGNILTKLMADNTLKIAFIYDKEASQSSWLYAHELGRLYLKDKLGDKIEIKKFICLPQGEISKEMKQVQLAHLMEGKEDEKTPVSDIETIIASGFNVIFAATPLLLQNCLQAAIEHPNVQIFSCAPKASWKSIRTYYVRMHEAKFITGLVAGAVARDKDIYFEADYPVFNAIANANAFALGVAMTNPQAKVHLVWAGQKDEYKENIQGNHAIISNKDMITASGYNHRFGLYEEENGEINNIATGIIDWGLFYEKIITQMMEGTFKKISKSEKKAVNYWWGLSSGVLDVVCSNKLPNGVKRMVDHFQKAIMDESFHVFEGQMIDQEGNIHGQEGSLISNEDIAGMDWLYENIIGSIPESYQLKEEVSNMVTL